MWDLTELSVSVSALNLFESSEILSLNPYHFYPPIIMTMDQQNSSVQSEALVLIEQTNENNKRALQTDGESQEQSHNKKRSLTFIASWQKKTYTMSCTPDETVEQLKLKLQGLTNVRPQNMKLLNLVKGKLPVSGYDILLKLKVSRA
jgi:hypothetical protein